MRQSSPRRRSPFVSVVAWTVSAALGFVAMRLAAIASGIDRVRDPDTSHPNPALDIDAARQRLEALQARDRQPSLEPACATALYEPEGTPCGTIVAFHGLTNCPMQFSGIARELSRAGYLVLVPRMPRHGHRDLLTRDLSDLHTDELVTYLDEVIDVAAGFGAPVSVIGMSAGATLALWAGAKRPEVDRVAVASPLIAPAGASLALLRLLVRFSRFAPRVWLWWDPIHKENLGESPYTYPGFPLSSIIPFIHLALALNDGVGGPAQTPGRVALISNPNDLLVRRSIAVKLIQRAFGQSSAELLEFRLSRRLRWWHDFIDPWSRHGGSPEEVAGVFRAALGIGDDDNACGHVSVIIELNAGAR